MCFGSQCAKCTESNEKKGGREKSDKGVESSRDYDMAQILQYCSLSWFGCVSLEGLWRDTAR